ncbi:MAG: hypothetical protein Ct9H300mP25_14840 [Acidobacteriota bacterium]|nr:MAG: hypothetical protein Ct9H300mP25_14840 [Acidobacteriota bacterium]
MKQTTSGSYKRGMLIARETRMDQKFFLGEGGSILATGGNVLFLGGAGKAAF